MVKKDLIRGAPAGFGMGTPRALIWQHARTHLGLAGGKENEGGREGENIGNGGEREEESKELGTKGQ